MSIGRRTFLQAAAAAAALGQGRGLTISNRSGLQLDWAMSQLRSSVKSGNTEITIELVRDSTMAKEGFAFAHVNEALHVSASDQRGFTYALLELADRAHYGDDLTAVKDTRQQPANPVRSMTRAFVSDVEDKPWFYDKEFWRDYLTQLAANRFNRFSLTLGLGYDFPRGVTGDYLHFPYPYLLDVPGYKVRAVPLDDAERDRNLEALRFISDETARRGLHFQLGIWTHAYEWTDSPRAQHHITGLTPETHGPYCRDAMTMLLKQCPNIHGLTMRVHGESGVAEGSYGFWQLVFDGIVRAGRTIEIDMHAKGLDQRMIDIGVKTGMPLKVSPKFWAEHMGLGYQQTAIRELEMPRVNDPKSQYFSLSEGSRRFMRYGYGDLFQEGRKFDVLFRMWPGTQRLLLWGDPQTAAGFGEAAHFAGASGVEICEPLFFKGRQGSGLPGGRCAYADASLNPKQDWQKYEYTYRLWGRLLYDPKAEPESWQRYLRGRFDQGAASVESALSNASRVLPLITTAHIPSASNLGCWMEVYTNMPIVEQEAPGAAPVPYADTVSPKRWGTVSPLDPQLFSSITEYVSAGNSRGAKYSPVEVAQWLEDLTGNATRDIAVAASKTTDRKSPDYRRVEEDVLIQIGLGRFFAAQLRSAVLYEIYLQTQDHEALREAIGKYQAARAAWAAFADRAKSVYRADITFGDTPVRRGDWIDRLPAIDKDLAAMRAKFSSPSVIPGNQTAKAQIHAALAKPNRVALPWEHRSVQTFHPGQAVPIALQIDAPDARLFYRHVDQAERWVSLEMSRNGNAFQAEIPATYTASPFHLQYYFDASGSLYPGLPKSLSGQPYFFVKRASA